MSLFLKYFLLSIGYTYGPIKLADISTIRSGIDGDNIEKLIELSSIEFARTVLENQECYYSDEVYDAFGSIIVSLIFTERNLDKYSELLRLREEYGYNEDELLLSLASNLRSLIQYRS